MAYIIRDYRDGDAADLAQVTLAAIQAIGSVRYSEEQVAAWAARHPGAERFKARAALGAAIFVAADAEDRPVGFSLLEMNGEERGHLDMLYCHPDHTRAGLADELLAHAEHFARAHGITRLFTEASELARRAFERAGYAVQKRCDFTIPYEGREVAIHNYAMEKSLA